MGAPLPRRSSPALAGVFAAWLATRAARAFIAATTAVGALACARSDRSTLTSNQHEQGDERLTLASGERVLLVELPVETERMPAPGFEAASEWLNVDRPLGARELAGRVTVVDFWTSGCINCVHAREVLERLEARFAGEAVTVLGVHSPKFDDERDVAGLRDFLVDHGITHPVAVDANMSIWDRWRVRAWPTIFVLDTSGRIVWRAIGEPSEHALASVVASALAEGRKHRSLTTRALSGLKHETKESAPLRYPGKVYARTNGELVISDTGHHRLVVMGASGQVEAIVGSGQPGLVDGPVAMARFRRPQGIAELGGALYVADTGNHALRRVDLATKTVTTIGGTGALGAGLTEQARPARQLSLRSPWGLLAVDGFIFVAFAGAHQIGLFDPRRETLRLYAGTGREAKDDGPRLRSTFAQPSDLATDDRELFVLDSESSSVRAIDLAKGTVRTVVGTGLFDFGDVDGAREVARLQHPTGLVYHAGSLYIADSYNSKVRRVDPRSGAVVTVAGGHAGALLNKPSGVATRGGDLFVADTNNHRIVRISLAADGGAQTGSPSRVVSVDVSNLASPAPAAPLPRVRPSDPVARLPGLRLARARPARVRVIWGLPPGTAINPAAPFKMTWVESEGLSTLPESRRSLGGDVPRAFEFDVMLSDRAAGARAVGVLEVVVCDSVTHAICVPVRRTVEASFAAHSSATRALATIALPAAKPPAWKR